MIYLPTAVESVWIKPGPMALTLIWYFLRTLIERFTQEVRLGYIGRLGTGIRTWASLLQSKVIVGRKQYRFSYFLAIKKIRSCLFK